MKLYLLNQNTTNLYKIGVTKKDISKRIKELQTGNGNELVLIKYFETQFNFKFEAAIHAHYRLSKINSEWFKLTNEQIEEFDSVCQLLESNLLLLKNSGNPFI
jgi:hypothetical protein